MALLNLAYGWFVLPESLPPERRRKFSFAAANPVASRGGWRGCRARDAWWP